MSPNQLDRDVRRIEDRFSQRVVVNKDRRTGETPLTVVQVGDSRFVWAATGVVGAGASSTLHLTLNGEAGGESIFKRPPLVFVGRDLAETAGGIATAGGPTSISQNWSIGARSGEMNVDLRYLGQTKAYSVTVTNLLDTPQNYVIQGFGVA